MLKNFSKIYFFRKESEQFLNNVEQKIILCKMLARNSLCRKQWTIFVRKQWIILFNVEIKFIFWN